MSRQISASRSGFTLVEILCVVIILGIAGAIIVPQLSSRDDLKAGAAARALMADLIYAQNRAITYQANQYIGFDTSAQTYTLMTAPGMTVLTHPVNKTSYVMRFGSSSLNGIPEARLVSADFRGATGQTRTTLGFDELGTPLACDAASGTSEAATTGNVVIQSGSYKLQVSVEPYTGQVSVAAIP